MRNHEVRDRQGRTRLHFAALSGDSAAVEELVAAGADLDSADSNGFTPLHLAAQEWNFHVAQMLLEAGAEVDRKNRYGNTALSVAVFNSRGRGELISLLRIHGADPLSENASGQTPLGLARLIANYDVAQYFADLEDSI
jgi:ankyrin repeat protein